MPLVYVSAEGVSWDGVSTAVRLKVVNPLGAVIVDETIGATAGSSKKLDFANGIAGDYEITLTAGDVTVSRYYKNKALNRVSDFSVADNGLLVWRPVPNAARYYVDVVCGDENHVHTHFDNGASVYFDFSNCKMRSEGIVFVVTATAEGYASSVSRAFVYLRKLPVVSGLHLDTESDWTLFLIKFEQKHSDYFRIMKERYPDLTTNDLRLSACLKMNLCTKEIASMMNLSVRAVENSRYRLRKKLGLTSAQNLNEFMMHIDSQESGPKDDEVQDPDL